MKKLFPFLLRFVIFGVIVGGLIFLLFFNSYLKISHWSILGAEMISDKDVQDLLLKETAERWLFFPQDNFLIMLVRSHSLGGMLKQNFKEIRNVSLRPDWREDFLNHFLVNIEERKKIGIWCGKESEQDCFFFDETGYLFKSVPESKGPFIINVKDEVGAELGLGDKIEDIDLVKSLIVIDEKFNELPLLVIETISVINQNHDFILKTNNGWILYFDPKESVADEFRVFKALLDKEEIKITDAIEYIDLRIKNRAYIKRR